jgi:DNA-binding NtrC family response regulator
MAATHRDLRARVAEGSFRQDLYYRLNVLDVKVPPLRERTGDLPLLVEHFLRRCSPPGKRAEISYEAWAKLAAHPFPGNIRELAHIIERGVVLSGGQEIRVEHLPSDLSGAASPQPTVIRPLQEAATVFERRHLTEALRAARGRRALAADMLEISRKTLWEKMRRHGISEAEIEDDPDEAGRKG